MLCFTVGALGSLSRGALKCYVLRWVRSRGAKFIDKVLSSVSRGADLLDEMPSSLSRGALKCYVLRWVHSRGANLIDRVPGFVLRGADLLDEKPGSLSRAALK